MNSRQRKPIADRQIIKQADQNRKHMTEKNPTKRRKALAKMRAITENPMKCKSFLMKSSMIEGLREVNLINWGLFIRVIDIVPVDIDSSPIYLKF